MAQWIVTGDAGIDLSRFRIDRFGDRYRDPDALREACLARYSHHYLTPEQDS
jgi:hypothetical protein